MLKRRTFIMGTCATASMLALRKVLSVPLATADTTFRSPLGELQPDPDRLLDLPPGFSYRVISRTGEEMDDGLLVPGMHDGMAAFAGKKGRVILVCNHELKHGQAGLGPFGAKNERLTPAVRRKLYDAGTHSPVPGGTTTTVYHPRTGEVEKRFLSLAGTERNCAGGPTPWGSWLSCEESVQPAGGDYTKDHGWIFEVPATANGLVEAEPIKPLGRFNHEAAAVDPATGIIYLTEDREDSLLYRFLPDPPGQARRGRLQALMLGAEKSADTRNWNQSGFHCPEGKSFSASWIDLDSVESPDDDLRLRGHARGAAVFARGEGMWFGEKEFYFTCTTGGAIRAGQIFRYRPGPHEGGQREAEIPGQLELFVESREPRQLSHCDNITVSPWGDLLVCEDTFGNCSVVGVTPDGQLYPFANNAYSLSELAGACFSPDGSTLFLNIQSPGLTLAITGPFPAPASQG